MLAFMSFSGIVGARLLSSHRAVVAPRAGRRPCDRAGLRRSTPASRIRSWRGPRPRQSIVTRSVLAIMLSAAFVLVRCWPAHASGCTCSRRPTSASGRPPRLLLSLIESLGALAWCWAGVAMAIAVRAPRRGVAGAATGVLALAAFLLDYVGRVWHGGAQRWARSSAFDYFSPFELLMGTPLRSVDLAVLLADWPAPVSRSATSSSREGISEGHVPAWREPLVLYVGSSASSRTV